MQEEVRPNQRVLSGALLLLVMNLIGLGLGPTWVGAASDWFRAEHPRQFAADWRSTRSCPFISSPCCFLWLARALKREARAGAAA